MSNGGRFSTCDLDDLRAALSDFANARDWQQFHTPRNLLLALVGEVGELSELFQWRGEVRPGLPEYTPEEREHVGQEMSDCLLYLIRMADVCGIDLSSAAMSKLKVNATRYPADRCRGSSAKYTAYVTTSSATQQAPGETRQRSDVTQGDQEVDALPEGPSSPMTAKSGPKPSSFPTTATATTTAAATGSTLAGTFNNNTTNNTTTNNNTVDMSLGTSPFKPSLQHMASVTGGFLKRTTVESGQPGAGAESPATGSPGITHTAATTNIMVQMISSSPQDRMKSAAQMPGDSTWRLPEHHHRRASMPGLHTPPSNAASPPSALMAMNSLGDLPQQLQQLQHSPNWTVPRGGRSPGRSPPMGRFMSDPSRPTLNTSAYTSGDMDDAENQKRKRFTDEQKRILTAVADAAGWSLLGVSQEDRDWLQEVHGITKDRLQNFLNNRKPRDFKGRRGVVDIRASLEAYFSPSKVTQDALYRHLPPSLATAQLQALTNAGVPGLGDPPTLPVPAPEERSALPVRPEAHSPKDSAAAVRPSAANMSNAQPMFLATIPSNWNLTEGRTHNPTSAANHGTGTPAHQQPHQQQSQTQQLQLVQMTADGNFEGVGTLNVTSGQHGEFQAVLPANMVFFSNPSGGKTGGDSGTRREGNSADVGTSGVNPNSSFQMPRFTFGNGHVAMANGMSGSNMGAIVQQGGAGGQPMFIVLPSAQAQAPAPMSMG